ncbi:GntR family transcriptional regulator, partial [bacterium]|nr:GntR family transcriptional regulator [bacterium]
MQFCLKDDKPIYTQVVMWIEQNILLGVFKENEAIPSVADISVKYKINPVIIKKGISVLIDKGIISCDLIVLNGTVNKLKM